MSLDDRTFDRRLRDRLVAGTPPAPAGLWDAIEAELPPEPRRRRGPVWIWIATATGVALVMLVALGWMLARDAASGTPGSADQAHTPVAAAEWPGAAAAAAAGEDVSDTRDVAQIEDASGGLAASGGIEVGRHASSAKPAPATTSAIQADASSAKPAPETAIAERTSLVAADDGRVRPQPPLGLAHAKASTGPRVDATEPPPPNSADHPGTHRPQLVGGGSAEHPSASAQPLDTTAAELDPATAALTEGPARRTELSVLPPLNPTLERDVRQLSLAPIAGLPRVPRFAYAFRAGVLLTPGRGGAADLSTTFADARNAADANGAEYNAADQFVGQSGLRTQSGVVVTYLLDGELLHRSGFGVSLGGGLSRARTPVADLAAWEAYAPSTSPPSSSPANRSAASTPTLTAHIWSVTAVGLYRYPRGAWHPRAGLGAELELEHLYLRDVVELSNGTTASLEAAGVTLRGRRISPTAELGVDRDLGRRLGVGAGARLRSRHLGGEMRVRWQF